MRSGHFARSFAMLFALLVLMLGTQTAYATSSDFVPVTGISGVPSIAYVGVPQALAGTVEPVNADNQTITWSVVDAGTTGATISGNTLKTTATGTATIRATITNGSAPSTDYTQDFDINVENVVAVTNFIDVPMNVTVGVPLKLTATVLPANATFKEITWRVTNANGTGAYIEDDVLYTPSTGNGSVYILANISHGRGAEDSWTHLTLKVNPFVPVTNISGVPTSEYVGYSVFLNGTVEPADASSKTIEWSVVDAGDTGATISKSKLTATAAGTAIIRATIKYGSVGASDYTQDFEFNFKNVIAVKSLEDCPNRTIAGVPLPLSATVVPEDATFQTVVWDITNAEGTGARIVGNVLYTTNPGIVRVLVNVIDHKGYSVYHVNYGILVDAHVPVTDISDVPASAYIGIDLPLSGTINPSTASFKAIEWSVVNPGETGATISGNTPSKPRPRAPP